MSNIAAKRKSSKNLLADQTALDLDLMAGLQYWWGKKIQYFFICLFTCLVLGTFLFFGLKVNHNSKLHYSQLVFKTATTNSPINLQRIINPELISRLVLQEEFNNLNPENIVNRLSLDNYHPLAQDISNQILNLNDTALKKLVLSGAQLEAAILQLDGFSQNHYVLRLTHNDTSITPAQASLLLNRLIALFNEKTSQEVDFQRSQLFFLKTIDDQELIQAGFLFQKIQALKDNIQIIKRDFSELVTGVDFAELQTNLNRFDQYLNRSSANAFDENTIRLQNKAEELQNKMDSLYAILNLLQKKQSNLPLTTIPNKDTSTIAQIDSNSIQSLLNLGQELSSVEMINDLASEIKELSFQKASIQSQLELNERLQNNVDNRDEVTVSEFNQSINQVNEIIQMIISEKNPTRYLNVVSPPKYFNDAHSFYQSYIRYLALGIIIVSLSLFLIYLLRSHYNRNH